MHLTKLSPSGYCKLCKKFYDLTDVEKQKVYPSSVLRED